MNTMQTTTAVGPSDRTRRRRARLVSVLAAVAGALGLWAVYVAFGIDLRSPAFGEYGGTAAVGAGNVAFVSALAAFTAWGLLAVLERLTPRARRMWLVIALLALVASLGGPWSGTGITTANRVELMGFHLLVGAVLIPLLFRTSAKPVASTSGGRDERRTEPSGTREAAA